MFFWKINLLKQRLISEGLSQKHLFIYMFIYVVLGELVLEVLYNISIEGLNEYDYAQSVVNFIVICLGTFLIYRANGGSHGKQFAERYFSIGFVIAIRFMALLIPVFIALGFIWFNEPIDSELTTTWYELVIFSIWMIGLYWRIIFHVKEVAIETTA